MKLEQPFSVSLKDKALDISVLPVIHKITTRDEQLMALLGAAYTGWKDVVPNDWEVRLKEPLHINARLVNANVWTSLLSPKKYEACPYCFTKLEPEPQIEQKKAPEPPVKREELKTEAESNQSDISVLKPKVAGPRFFQKVKSLISSVFRLTPYRRQFSSPPTSCKYMMCLLSPAQK